MTGTDAGEDSLRNISDTALWVAIYRAMESERPDALFRDPHARRLGGRRGEAIVASLPKARGMAWPMIVRTAVMDEIIVRTVRRDGVRSVVNLAAGLDTRPYRLLVPESLRWLHVDLPGMVDYLRERLTDHSPACGLEFIGADLTERPARRAVFEKVAAAPGPTLAVTEGLLVYLHPEQVAELARDLAAIPSVTGWLIDLGSPRLLEMLRKTWHPQLAAAGAPMIFGPEEGTRFFEPHGWREAEYRPMWNEAMRLNRGPRGAWLWSMMSRFMSRARREELSRLSGIVLLGRV